MINVRRRPLQKPDPNPPTDNDVNALYGETPTPEDDEEEDIDDEEEDIDDDENEDVEEDEGDDDVEEDEDDDDDDESRADLKTIVGRLNGAIGRARRPGETMH